MQILEYKKSSEIEEKYIPSLFDGQVECWGSEPFGEYKVCENEKCGALFSLEKVCGNINSLRAGNNGEDFCCSECNSKTKFIYSNPEFLEIVKEYIKGDVSSILLIDDADIVEGFGVVKKTTLESILDIEFATRPNSYDYEKVLEQISLSLFGKKDASFEEIILLHQIFVSESFRGGNMSFDILKKLIFLNEEYKDIPVIGETRFDSKFYPISRSIGFENILNDKHGYVIQGIQNYEQIMHFLANNSSFSGKNVLGNLLHYRKEAKAILSQNGSFSGQKFYK